MVVKRQKKRTEKAGKISGKLIPTHGPPEDVGPPPTPQKRKRDLTHKQQAALRPIVERLIVRFGNQTRLAEQLDGFSQSAISSFLSGKQGMGWGTALQIIELAGADLFDVMGVRRPNGTRAVAARVVPAAEMFFRAVDPSTATLREFIAAHGTRLGLTSDDIFRAWEILPNVARLADNTPKIGWEAFFAELRAGKYDPAPRPRAVNAKALVDSQKE